MAKGKAKQGNVDNILREYWLYFVPGQGKIQNWFCKGFGHIAILTHDKDYWFIIDPQPSQLKIELWPFKKSNNKDFPLILSKIYKSKTCIKLTIDQKEIKSVIYKWWYLFMPRFVSCVSIIEYILGIKLKGVTPRGVAKHLKINFDAGKVKNPIKQISFLPILKEN